MVPGGRGPKLWMDGADSGLHTNRCPAFFTSKGHSKSFPSLHLLSYDSRLHNANERKRPIPSRSRGSHSNLLGILRKKSTIYLPKECVAPLHDLLKGQTSVLPFFLFVETVILIRILEAPVILTLHLDRPRSILNSHHLRIHPIL